MNEVTIKNRVEELRSQPLSLYLQFFIVDTEYNISSISEANDWEELCLDDKLDHLIVVKTDDSDMSLRIIENNNSREFDTISDSELVAQDIVHHIKVLKGEEEEF